MLGVRMLHGGPKPAPSPLLAIGLSVFVAWAALGLAWAPIPLPAGWSILSLAGMFIAGMIFLGLVPALEDAGRRRVENWFLAGYGAANLIFLFEAISGNWISRRVRGLEWREIISIEGIGENLDAFLSNGIVILALLVWPAITIFIRRKQWVLIILALVMVLGVASHFRHSASLLAVLAGLCAWGVGRFSRRLAARLLALGFVLMVLASPFLMGQLTRSVDLHKLANSDFGRALPQSVIPRLFIWDFAAQKSLERPLLGWGMNASRLIPGGGEKFIVYDERAGNGQGKQLYTDSLLPLHPHNQALQIWLELGGVGAFIVAIFGGAFLFRLGALGAAEAPLFGMLVSYLTFALSSFGAWQNWWIATLFLIAIIWRTLGREPPITSQYP
jgi:O-antigen ligase